MPIYEYECNNCKNIVEFIQSITEGRKKKCPKCLKMRLRKLPSHGVSAHFKGSGFYSTDYKQ